MGAVRGDPPFGPFIVGILSGVLFFPNSPLFFVFLALDLHSSFAFCKEKCINSVTGRDAIAAGFPKEKKNLLLSSYEYNHSIYILEQ